MSRVISPALLIVTLGRIIACTPTERPDAVVTIDGRSFSQTEFFSRMTPARFFALDLDGRREAVEQFAREKIILMEASERDVPGKQDATNLLEALKRKEVVDRIIAEEVWEPLLSDSSLRLLYERQGRAVGIQQIIIPYKGAVRSGSNRSEEEAAELGFDIKEKIEQGDLTFLEAAEEYAGGTSGLERSRLVYVRWGELFEPVQSVAFSLPVGEVSDPFRSDFGYHLVRVGGMKTIRQPPFEQVKSRLRQFIRGGDGHEFEVALARFESRLNRMYKVRFNEDMVKNLFKALVLVHEGLEGAPRAKEINSVDLKGIVCTAGGDPYDVDWFKDRISSSLTPVGQSAIISRVALQTTLEHVVYRFLGEKYASETRGPEWHGDVWTRVHRTYFKTIESALLKEVSKTDPGVSGQEWLQSLLDRYSVRVNEDFLISHPLPSEQDSV